MNIINFLTFSPHSDEDMQSMASLMSTNNTIDIAIMKDFDEEEEDEGKIFIQYLMTLVENINYFSRA